MAKTANGAGGGGGGTSKLVLNVGLPIDYLKLLFIQVLCSLASLLVNREMINQYVFFR